MTGHLLGRVSLCGVTFLAPTDLRSTLLGLNGQLTCEDTLSQLPPAPYRLAGGTLITPARDMADALVTCIVLKPHVTLMDIVSTKMLGQFGFLVRGGQVSHRFPRLQSCHIFRQAGAAIEHPHSLRCCGCHAQYRRNMQHKGLRCLHAAFTLNPRDTGQQTAATAEAPVRPLIAGNHLRDLPEAGGVGGRGGDFRSLHLADAGPQQDLEPGPHRR